jgi:beta-glucosidase
MNINETHKAGDSVRVSVEVKNTGKVGGDEVVQLYLSNNGAAVPVPIHSLKGFRRIHLEPGEAKSIEFILPPDAFSVITNDNKREVLPGNFDVFVGGGLPPRDKSVSAKGLRAQLTLQ